MNKLTAFKLLQDHGVVLEYLSTVRHQWMSPDGSCITRWCFTGSEDDYRVKSGQDLGSLITNQELYDALCLVDPHNAVALFAATPEPEPKEFSVDAVLRDDLNAALRAAANTPCGPDVVRAFLQHFGVTRLASASFDQLRRMHTAMLHNGGIPKTLDGAQLEQAPAAPPVDDRASYAFMIPRPAPGPRGLLIVADVTHRFGGWGISGEV